MVQIFTILLSIELCSYASLQTAVVKGKQYQLIDQGHFKEIDGTANPAGGLPIPW